MATKLECLSRNLYCLRSELLGPVISINSANKLLVGKAPETVNKNINQIDSISNQLLSEIHPIPSNVIDQQPLDHAAKQLQFLANNWEKNIEDLSFHLNKVKSMESQLEDADKILITIISNGLQKFRRYIRNMKMIRTEHLTQDEDGFAKILNINIPK